ncbi:outer membrane beta-barrel protein [Kordiimonas aquimaris]|uniref:outer membrane beta-barrel protein n=1 Tax=Kordiimonas aquimaris TaxID=707591 RepID=UPI0021D1F72A|nr:outer membrane beta-barrel protein [Kordiimonas aquimaris]
MKFRTLSSMTAILASMGVSYAVSAQSSEQVVSVYERQRPDYSVKGGRSGSFLFKPTLDVAGSFDTNIFAQESNETDDFIARIKPGFDLSSDWNNNSLSFFGNADFGRYFDNTRENYEDIWLGASGRIDISRGTSLSANIGYTDLHEDRGSPDALGQQANQTTYSTFTAGVGFLRDEALVSFAANAKYEDSNYDDVGLVGGGTLNNDDRDRQRYSGDVRIGYEIDEFYEAFLRVSANRVEYDNSQEDGGPQRNSDGYEIVAGAAFDLTGTSQGEVFAGYINQEYDSDSLSDIGDFTFGASLLWNPTGLTSVRGAISRTVTETIVADLDPTGAPAQASGILGTVFDLQLEHELQRNVLLKGTATYIKQDFQNTVRDDDLFNASLGASYLINRNFSFDATYTFNYRDTTTLRQDFKRHIFMLGLKAKW